LTNTRAQQPYAPGSALRALSAPPSRLSSAFLHSLEYPAQSIGFTTTEVVQTRLQQAGYGVFVIMKEVIFRVAQRDDYPELAEWFVQMSQAPEQHCLHTWAGQSAAELQQQLLSYWDESELCHVMALRDDQLVGAMGSEYDEGLERGWLHGPHVATGDWERVAGELFTRLLAELPTCIGQLDAYLNVENVRGRRFYVRQGFKKREHLNYDFWLAPDKRVVSGDRRCTLLRKEHETSFKQLYDALFPSAYYRAERVLQMRGQSHQVLVTEEEEEVLGFAVVSVEGNGSTGEIQFFGVRENSRRQGYGRRLLLAAIDWLFDRAGVSRVCLNVGEELVHARGLYESVGFRLRFTGVGLSKALAR
jgi:ribosomal protein S18 acetylase RimI-like enzyme